MNTDKQDHLKAVPIEYLGIEAVPGDAGINLGSGQHLALRPVTDRHPVDINRFTLVVDKPSSVDGEPVVKEGFHQRRFVLFEGGRKARVIWALTPQEALEEAVDYMLIPRTETLMQHILATYASHDPMGEGMTTKAVKLMVVPQLGLIKRQLTMVKEQKQGRSLFNSNFAFANNVLSRQDMIRKLPETRDVFAITDKGREMHAKGERVKRASQVLPTQVEEVDLSAHTNKSRLLEHMVRELGAYCQGCGRGPEVDLMLGHKLPQAEGGSDLPDNLAPLCRTCDDRKGNDLTLTGLRKRNLSQGLLVDGQVLRNWRARPTL